MKSFKTKRSSYNAFKTGSEPFTEGFAMVTDGYKGYSFINSYRFITKCKEGVLGSCSHFIYDDAKSFSNGLAAVEKENKWGYINTFGREVIPLSYDKAASFHEGLAKVESNGKRSFINKNRETVFSCYECTTHEYADGLMRTSEYNEFKFIDKNGKTLIQIEAQEVQKFSEGLAFIYKNEKWGIIKNPLYANSDKEQVFVAKKTPPIIKWTNPNKEITYTDSKTLKVKICITSPKKSNTEYRLFKDGRLISSSSERGFPIENDSDVCDYTITHDLNLEGIGLHELRLEVSNDYGKVTENRTIHSVHDIDIAPPIAGKYYLLLIGIDKYKNDAIPSLYNAKNDINAIEKLLTTKYRFSKRNVIRLTDYEATNENIIGAFNRLGKKLKSNDKLLIYYAGHGAYSQTKSEGYWIPFDAPARDYSKKHISYKKINQLICEMPCQNVYLIADNCFAGNLIRGGLERPYTSESSRSTLVAGSGAVDDGNRGTNSPFTKVILKFLTDNNELYLPATFMEPHIRVAVKKVTEGKQTPDYGRNRTCQGMKNDGDFVFEKRN